MHARSDPTRFRTRVVASRGAVRRTARARSGSGAIATVGERAHRHAAGVDHQQNGWLRYPPCKWDHPAILAFDESGTCVGGINWGEDHDDRTLTITFAWGSPTAPAAFAAVLSRFRKTHLNGWFTEIHFTISTHNEAMQKAVKVLGLVPRAFTFEMPVKAMARS